MVNGASSIPAESIVSAVIGVSPTTRNSEHSNQSIRDALKMCFQEEVHSLKRGSSQGSESLLFVEDHTGYSWGVCSGTAPGQA